MTIATKANSLATQLNAALPGALASYLQYISFGSILRQSVPTTLRRCSPNTAAANPYLVAGQSVSELNPGTIPPSPLFGTTPAPVVTALGANLTGQLPDDAKACTVLRATAVAGTGTLGSLVVDLQATNDTNFASAGTGPAAGHVGVSPSGDIVTNATDAWTSVDVTYVPEKQDAFELAQAAVVPGTGVCSLPAAQTTQGVVTLMEAEALTGTTTGKFAVLPPSNSAPAATKQANLNLAKTQVLFKVSDAVSLARLKLGLVSAVDSNLLLELTAPII